MHWWAWGDTDEQAWTAFADVCRAMTAAVDLVEAQIRQASLRASDTSGSGS